MKIFDRTDGIAPVQFDDKSWNFIDANGNILSSEHFLLVSPFSDGFASVKRQNGKWNIINRTGQIVSPRDYDWVGFLSENFIPVLSYEKNGYNFIDKNGNLLCSSWHDAYKPFSFGFAAVKAKRKGWNFIDHSGNYISEKWFHYAESFRNDAFAMVSTKKNNLWNAIDKKGQLILKQSLPDYDNAFQTVIDILALSFILSPL